MIHCRMLDGTAQLQQEALGILGVNLVHGCLSKCGKQYDILSALMSDLNRRRIEVTDPPSMPLLFFTSVHGSARLVM